MLSWGFVLFKMYTWFIIPLYIETPAPSFTAIQAVGVVFFINCFFFKVPEGREKKEFTGFPSLDVTPWVTLLCAWLFKVFLY